MSDLRPKSEAVFLRLREAYEVLSDTEKRARYESTLARSDTRAPGVPSLPDLPPPALDEEFEALRAETVVRSAKKQLAEGKYWDAIQNLEGALKTTGGAKISQTIRILLARATSKNPKWLKRAEESLLSVIREDPGHVEAHLELGLVYKSAGLKSRARAELKKVLELDPGNPQAAAELRSLDGAPDDPLG